MKSTKGKTKSTGLGTWRNAPLVYVVAELTISPHYSVGAKMATLQDLLRQSFPRTLESPEIVVEAGVPKQQPRWQLISSESTHGVLVGSSKLALHATTYTESSDFLARWTEVLEAIEQSELGAFVERAGLRYVDVILPSEGKSPEQYIALGLQGISPEGAVSAGSIWASAFRFERCFVNLRVGAPSPHSLLLPTDLGTMPLNKPAIMLEAENRRAMGKPVGFIDTDCIWDIGAVLKAADLTSVYAQMHQYTSGTFRASLSDLALGEWR